MLAFGFSSPVFAWDWNNFWSNPNQQANQAFTQEDYQGAVFLFEDIAWRAAANYRQGNYEASLTDLTDLHDVNSLYNQGNALAMLYRLNEAIDIYRRVLNIDPDHEAARLVRRRRPVARRRRYLRGDLVFGYPAAP